MIVLLLVIPLACVVCFAGGYQIGRTVEYFACQRDPDRKRTVMPHGEHVLLGLVLGALGGLLVGCTWAWLRADADGPSPMTARARRSPDGGTYRSNTVRLEAAQRKRARRAERNLQIAGRRRSRHLENGQPPPSVRWWRRTASRRS